MNRRLARVLSAAVVVICFGSFAAGGAIVAATRDRIPEGTVVVVGNESTPGMREAITELQQRAAEGDDLISGSDIGTVLF
ncbi:MAG: hypothetical protein ACRDG2_09060, partial [Actinomycetota bacterium]